jgi:Trk K+ transport system NAD-binding subunit
MQAGVQRPDVVVADTGDDEDNLVVRIITKKHSQARCIARVNNPKNKRIADVRLPRGSVIVAVDRGNGEVLVPNGDTLLQRGDDVIAMIKRDTRPDVCSALVG